MTVDTENPAGAEDIRSVEAPPEAPESPVTRRRMLRTLSEWSLLRRTSLASAAIFAGFAARGTEPAFAANWKCCTLARMDQWCAGCACDPPFWCNYGGFKRVWYCCYGGRLYGCGECQSGTGTCHNGPVWYCSYGWLAFNDC